jgi:hypothetical protein
VAAPAGRAKRARLQNIATRNSPGRWLNLSSLLEPAEHPDRLEAIWEIGGGFIPVDFRDRSITLRSPAGFESRPVPTKDGRWPLTTSSTIPWATLGNSPSFSTKRWKRDLLMACERIESGLLTTSNDYSKLGPIQSQPLSCCDEVKIVAKAQATRVDGASPQP